MKLFRWSEKPWRKHMALAASLVAIVLLASHPELRLLLPVIDALGLDLFLTLLGAELWNHLRPVAVLLYSSLILPAGRKAYSVVLFFFGCGGPYVHATLSARFPFRALAS